MLVMSYVFLKGRAEGSSFVFSLQIDKTGCGTAKGCFSLPSDCRGSDDCNFLFTYQVSGGNVFMEMSAKQRWVSVAFNEQQKMVGVTAVTKSGTIHHRQPWPQSIPTCMTYSKWRMTLVWMLHNCWKTLSSVCVVIYHLLIEQILLLLFL